MASAARELKFNLRLSKIMQEGKSALGKKGEQQRLVPADMNSAIVNRLTEAPMAGFLLAENHCGSATQFIYGVPNRPRQYHKGGRWIRYKMAEGNKLWGGRFTGSLDPVMEKLNASINYDKRLWKADIKGSLAYVQVLEKAGLVTKEEMESISSGLKQVYTEWEQGVFEIKSTDEDIHTANERRLKEFIGPVGGKLHTGRSRNDQVATDMRLWLVGAGKELKDYVLDILKVIVHRAENEIEILMPGYTHLQRAQPIRWSHWLLSYASMFQRDVQRLDQLLCRVSTLVLGSGALAGNPFPIDRNFLKEELQMMAISTNSLDAVSDRDFVAEFLFWSSLLGVHLSRLAEDLILYSSKEFAFVSLSDAYSTGSSLMPQKKNSDSLELMRGKAGRLYGNCTTMMIAIKGIPSTYNKDMQEDKEAMFDSYDTLCGILQVASGVISTLKINDKSMEKALSPDMLATDIAYYLVKKGLPFRDAHGVAGQCVAKAEEQKVSVSKLSHSELHNISFQGYVSKYVPSQVGRDYCPGPFIYGISSLLEEDVKELWNYSNSVDQYNAPGGTGKESVKEQIQSLRKWIEDSQKTS